MNFTLVAGGLAGGLGNESRDTEGTGICIEAPVDLDRRRAAAFAERLLR